MQSISDCYHIQKLWTSFIIKIKLCFWMNDHWMRKMVGSFKLCSFQRNNKSLRWIDFLNRSMSNERSAKNRKWKNIRLFYVNDDTFVLSIAFFSIFKSLQIVFLCQFFNTEDKSRKQNNFAHKFSQELSNRHNFVFTAIIHFYISREKWSTRMQTR